MKGQYSPFNDGFGIVGYGYVCPKCKHETLFTDCEQDCKNCGFSEKYEDPDDWYEGEMAKPVEQRAWNVL